MWCPHCQADVATEVAADGQSLLCTACGGEIRKVFAPSLHPETRSARELLERWSAEELLHDAGGPLPPLPEAASRLPDRLSDRAAIDAAAESEPAPREDSPASASGRSKSRPKFRFDGAHPPEERIGRSRPAEPPPRSRPQVAASSSGTESSATAPDRGASRQARSASPPRSDRLPPGFRQDQGHAALSGPHFDLQAALEPKVSTGQSESLWGQLLAYLGVGVLTIGAVMVVWGHFGGLPSYSSNGWLIATGGQMLLFLGVVTLVSGGMQQTTHEVTRRVEHLGERLIRFEHATRDLLHGPHYNRLPSSDDSAAAAVPRDEESQRDH